MFSDSAWVQMKSSRSKYTPRYAHRQNSKAQHSTAEPTDDDLAEGDDFG